MRKSNAVCIEDDEDDLDGFDVSDIPMRSVSNCSQRVKKTSLGINSHLTIPTGRRSSRQFLAMLCFYRVIHLL